MRTNIEIDDKLMESVMAAGGFKTKREAVEAGLKLIKRRHAYAAIRAARGTLFWDDSDEAWAKSRAERGTELPTFESQAAASTASLADGIAILETAVPKAVMRPRRKVVQRPAA